MIALPACMTISPPAQPKPEPPLGGIAARNGEARRLTAALAERGRLLGSMQTTAVMEYTAGDRHVKAREDIAVSRPDNLRVDARSPFGVALVMAARGGELAVFEPERNRFMRGAATAQTLDRYVRDPDGACGCGGPVDGTCARRFHAGTGGRRRAPDDGAMLVAAYGGAGSELRQAGFSGGNLAMLRDTAADGQVRYEVRYSEYHDIGGLMFPYVVDADFPPAQSHVTFHYVRPIINGNIPPSRFVLTPAPGAAIMNLGWFGPHGGDG